MRASARLRHAAGGAFLLALLACGGSGGGSAPPGGFVLIEPPDNPAWVAFVAAEAAGEEVPELMPMRYLADAVTRARGAIPRPPPGPPQVGGLCSFPAKYDLRTLGRSTPAWGSDCPCGTCWTSATLGSVESSLAPWGFHDFSENHLELGRSPSAKCLQPGHAIRALPYLASWHGPVDNADFDACAPGHGDSAPRLPARAHVQNVLFLPDRKGPLDNCWIKWAVTHLGGVYASTNYSGYAVTLDTNFTHYDPADITVHAVTIVGWDDTFDRNLFYCNRPTLAPEERIPPGDGAFIVKDNKGPSVFEQGHWYVSYYDGSIARPAAVFVGEPLGTLARIYQWDELGNGEDGVLLANPQGTKQFTWQGNVFTAKADEYLTAVSLSEFSSHEADYDVRVYLDPVGGPSRPGVPAAALAVSLPTMGYFTVRLPQKILLKAGQRFGVVLRGIDRVDGMPTMMSVEEPETAGATTGAGPGQSYLSIDGTTWVDLTTSFPTLAVLAQTNLRIKAFTTPAVAATADLLAGDMQVAWDLVNEAATTAWARPMARRRIVGRQGLEDVGEILLAVRYEQGGESRDVGTDGWVPVPSGARVRAYTDVNVLDAGDQLAWWVDVRDPASPQEILPGEVHHRNDFLTAPVQVVGTSPADGERSFDPEVPFVTLYLDTPVRVGPGLRGVTLSCSSEVKAVLPVVQGDELRLVPVTPLRARASDGAAGTKWTLHVPSDAVLSESTGMPLAADQDVTFTIADRP